MKYLQQILKYFFAGKCKIQVGIEAPKITEKTRRNQTKIFYFLFESLLINDSLPLFKIYFNLILLNYILNTMIIRLV